MTLRERVTFFLQGSKETYTATRLCEIFVEAGYPTKLASLSSVLRKMTDANLIERIENFGPRGGYGYRTRNT